MKVIEKKKRKIVKAEDIKIKKEFEDFILANDHPCMMAQTVFRMNKFELKTYKDFGSQEAARKILRDLKKYIENYDFESNDFETFIAVFPEAADYSETAFESVLWKQLQNIHELDKEAWDSNVAKDPQDENFSFSIGGRAFYVVGLHPNSSRIARQSPYPALTFNLHWQFEKLREMGSYETVRDRIRERDIKLQGDMNPMLQDFGRSSEAKQYSGRKVESDWKCPFHNKK